MMELFKRVWHDPVWSKVIATAIAGMPALAAWLFQGWVFADIQLSRFQVIAWCIGGIGFGAVMGGWAVHSRTRTIKNNYPAKVEEGGEVQALTLIPLDVYLEVNDSPTIEYKRKLRIVLRNVSEHDVLVKAGQWRTDIGDIEVRPLKQQSWDPETEKGWTSGHWSGPGRPELLVHPGQAFSTWVGLMPSVVEQDVRRRFVTQRLGTLIIPLTTQSGNRTKTLRL